MSRTNVQGLKVVRGTEIQLYIFAIFYKGGSICDFLFASLQTNPFRKGSILKGMNLLSSFHLRMGPFSEGHNSALIELHSWKYIYSLWDITKTH